MIVKLVEINFLGFNPSYVSHQNELILEKV